MTIFPQLNTKQFHFFFSIPSWPSPPPPISLFSFSSSLHVHARDGQFFSKISTNNNNAKETTQLLPNKQEVPLNKQEQESNFIPQNQQNTGNYGLYGHESSQLPPATTTTTGNLPYKTESEEPYNKEYYPNSNTNKENRQYYNNDAYFTDPQGMSDTRFMEKVYTTPITSNNDNNNYYNGGNMYNSRQQGIGASKFSATNYGNKYNNGGNMYNYDKPCMSDTRLLENGRYYYDLNSENYNLNANENSRGFESRNEYYNNRGYYGNSLRSRSEYYNNRGQHGNNENSYEFNNSMEGYNQNQEEFQESQEEFQESQDEQFMP